MATTALEVAELLAQHGIRSTVVDPLWVLPVQPALIKLAGEHDHVVTIEDGLVDGGIGALLGQRTAEAGLAATIQCFGVPLAFLDHATRDQIITGLRLRATDIARDVLDTLASRE